MTKIKEQINETEEMDQEISFDNSENRHEFSVSNEEILDVIDSKSHESHSEAFTDKITDIKGMIALNIMESGYFDNETISNNKLENAYDNFIDYDGVTNYSILERPKIVMESIIIDEYPNTIKERIDEDIDGYKHPAEVTELGISAELEYEHNKDKILKDSQEWVSPFKTFKSEI